MRCSFLVGRLAGIEPKIHGTFSSSSAWIGFIYYREGKSLLR